MRTIEADQASRRSPTRGAAQNPWAMWSLSIITIGIYAAVRHYQVNRELRDFGIEVDPVKALIAFFPGGLLFVPYVVTNYRTSERIAVAQETLGLIPSARADVAAITSLFAFLHVPYLQTQLNRAWLADSGRNESGDPPKRPVVAINQEEAS